MPIPISYQSSKRDAVPLSKIRYVEMKGRFPRSGWHQLINRIVEACETFLLDSRITRSDARVHDDGFRFTSLRHVSEGNPVGRRHSTLALVGSIDQPVETSRAAFE